MHCTLSAQVSGSFRARFAQSRGRFGNSRSVIASRPAIGVTIARVASVDTSERYAFASFVGTMVMWLPMRTGRQYRFALIG